MSLQEAVRKATSENNTSEDWALFTNICEQAGRNEASAREVVDAVRVQTTNRNANVVLFALTLANSLVMNCTIVVHREIASRSFCDTLVKQINNRSIHEAVRTRMLGMIQQWAEAFRGNSQLGYMDDVYQQLKHQGHRFPGPPEKEPVKQSTLQKRAEEDELQMALAMSLSSEEQDRERRAKLRQSYSKPVESPKPQQAPALFQVRALYDFAGTDEGEIPMTRGDVIDVYDATTFKDWWKGKSRGRIGLFPSNYVERLQAGAGTRTEGPSDATKGDVLAHTQTIEELLQLLTRLDPSRDNVMENARIQQLYHDTITLRPALVRNMEAARTQQDELLELSDRFVKANATYHHLMELAVSQYHTGLGRQTGMPGYSQPGASTYVVASQPPAIIGQQQQQQQPPAAGPQGYFTGGPSGPLPGAGYGYGAGQVPVAGLPPSVDPYGTAAIQGYPSGQR